MMKLILTALVLWLLLAGGACMVVPLHGQVLVHPYEQPAGYLSYGYPAHPIAYSGYYGHPISYGYYARPVVIHRSYISYGVSPITWSYGYPRGYTYWP
ncbi:MAG: hypothetical protein HY788_16890 [Deltaproteobacteria bacterium]|nr:hypothetical protein [Deltaproteobacteria bacterium]